MWLWNNKINLNVSTLTELRLHFSGWYRLSADRVLGSELTSPTFFSNGAKKPDKYGFMCLCAHNSSFRCRDVLRFLVYPCRVFPQKKNGNKLSNLKTRSALLSGRNIPPGFSPRGCRRKHLQVAIISV